MPLNTELCYDCGGYLEGNVEGKARACLCGASRECFLCEREYLSLSCSSCFVILPWELVISTAMLL